MRSDRPGIWITRSRFYLYHPAVIAQAKAEFRRSAEALMSNRKQRKPRAARLTG